jgi:integrase
MPKQSHLLDDIQIKHWIAKKEPVAKSDGDGLTFTLSAAGTSTWVLRYRMGGGRRKELTLGNYPDLSLAAARKLARAKRVEIDHGEDPAANKKAEKARSVSAWTVKMLAKDFAEKKLVVPEISESTIYYRTWDLDNIIIPKLGSLEVRKVSAADIVHMIESSKRTWAISKRLLTTVTQLFAHACGKRMIDANPCVGIDLKALMGPRPPVRRRVMLNEEELRSLLADLEDVIGLENSLALRILLVTCVRSIELAKARKEHIDLKKGTWWVPDESVKTRSGFLVPLTPTTINWFQQLFDRSGESDYLLPARTERRRRRLGDTHVSKTTLWASIARAFDRSAIEIRRFTPHDTRSTAKGHMRNMGIKNEITEIALNHKLKGMEGIYDVREEIPERRDALERWAAFIEACENGRPWNVTSINAAA